MIGEQFDHGDEICGAVVSVRGKQAKIAIWTKNATNEVAQVIVVEFIPFFQLSRAVGLRVISSCHSYFLSMNTSCSLQNDCYPLNIFSISVSCFRFIH